MALMQLAGALVEAECDVRIIDGEVESLSLNELVDRICSMRPDFVGVTGTTPEFAAAKFVIEETKQRFPSAVTVIGGAHATHVPWDVANQIDGIDYVVVFEGEKALAAICTGDNAQLNEYTENAQQLLEMKGIGSQNTAILLGPNQTVKDLERVKPARTMPIIDMCHYRYADPQLGLVATESVETTRGCPDGCTFCSSARSGLGMRSVDSILDESVTTGRAGGMRKAPKQIVLLCRSSTLAR
jgi:radical SAM superfamily enzyme YgiQ (UPF0313 family)